MVIINNKRKNDGGMCIDWPVSSYGPGTRFSKLPVITGPVKLFCFPF